MTKQEADFKELHKQFMREVIGKYDSRLKGNYFIHQFEPNRDNKGIDYDSGGKKLKKQGDTLILPAVQLYTTKYAELHSQVSEEYQRTLHNPRSESWKKSS